MENTACTGVFNSTQPPVDNKAAGVQVMIKQIRIERLSDTSEPIPQPGVTTLFLQRKLNDQQHVPDQPVPDMAKPAATNQKK